MARDFWSWGIDWPASDIEIEVIGSFTEAVSSTAETTNPQAKANAINISINAALGVSFGLLTDMWGDRKRRADRWLAFYADAEIKVTFTNPALADLLGFDATADSVPVSGGIHVVRAPRAFAGAFAAPVDRFQFILVDDHIIQSVSNPYSGPPVTVPRGEYKKIHVRHQYVPGAMVFSDRLEVGQIRTAAGLLEGDAHYPMDQLWRELSKGLSGTDVECYPRVSSRLSSADKPADSTILTTSPLPFPDDYTDDGLAVYFRDAQYFDSPHSMTIPTRSETGLDSYHIEFEVYSDVA